jgi:hypothetical protein
MGLEIRALIVQHSKLGLGLALAPGEVSRRAFAFEPDL